MVGSALVYVAFTFGSAAVHGWGIPMATDLALALWLALYKAGISPTLAGVAMGLLATTRPHVSTDELETRTDELEARTDELAEVSSAWAVLRTIGIARGATPTAERLELLLHP